MKLLLLFKPSHQFTVVEQLDRFEADVVEKPFFKLLSELSNFIFFGSIFDSVPFLTFVLFSLDHTTTRHRR
jgi:hypothetical protein